MKRYDTAIIGGGISGLGVALGLPDPSDSILIDGSGLAKRTSDNSLRIIHGGLRYLQSFDLPRVRRSASAQARIVSESGDFVQPLPCIMPLERSGLKSAPFVRLGLMAYRFLSYGVSAPAVFQNRVLSATEAHSYSPFLSTRAESGALLWYDYVMPNPSQFVERYQKTYEERGGEVRTDLLVQKISKVSEGFLLTSEKGELLTRRLVCALGGYRDSPVRGEGVPNPFQKLSFLRAFNLVINKPLNSKAALGITSPGGRLFFLVPRGEEFALGTFYEPPQQQGELTVIDEEEIQSVLSEFQSVVPELSLTRSDISRVEVGLLPLNSSYSAGKDVSSCLLKEDALFHEEDFFEVLSTKYTTFRTLGEKVGALL